MENELSIRVIDLASKAGRLLLESGSDITRVEDTISHILDAFGIKDYDLYTLTNGIFLSSLNKSKEGKHDYTRINTIPSQSTNLGRIDAINTLSRDIAAGKCTIDEAETRLDKIEHAPPMKTVVRLLATALASGAFCIMFGGGFIDGAVCAVIGFLYYFIAIRFERTQLSKLLTTGVCGIIFATLAILSYHFGLCQNLDKVIIGDIMPLIPGLSTVNAVRDIAAGDYLSGAVRIIDAVVITVGIAVGVGTAIIVFTAVGII